MKGWNLTNSRIFKIKKKRPGVHSKCRHTKQKTGKYYCGTKYKGQGR